MLRAIKEKFFKSEYSKHVVVLTSGTGLAQMIGIFTAPVMTRIYKPEWYAVLAVYMMITGLIGSVTTLQYQNVIIIAKEEEEAKNALSLGIATSAVISIVSLLVFLIAGAWVSILVNNKGVEYWLYIAPLSIFFTGWNTSFSAWANRSKDFKVLSFNRITAALLVPAVSITIGLLIKGAFGLLVGLLISQVIPALMLSQRFFKVKGNKLDFNLDKLKAVAWAHINFPKYTLTSEFINNLVNQIPVFFMSRYFGDVSLGNFNLTNRILGMPVQLVSTSVGEVYRQRASKDYNETGNCSHIYNKTFKTLTLLSLVPFLILAIFGKQLFVFVFGNEWQLAGDFSVILTLMYFFRFTATPLSYTYFIARKTKEDFWFHIVFGSVLFVALFFIVQNSTSVDGFLWVFMGVYSLAYLVSLIRTYSFSKGK